MAVIVRTAGMERAKPEIRRDFEYLLRLWDEIREVTLKSSAPALIYEEASLIKRSIRDLYTRDIGDIIVAGEEWYRAARDFMRTLTPSHTRRVQAYRDQSQPLFQRYQIESQIAAIHEPVVHLRSGGYIVLNQTEALVAIDVNSGRATRERNIEETALRTNVEAAEEVARQLRLRDLAGLIVIDFIDMEENRNNAQVERRLKEALKNDRARIQIGRISTFGLLEMSRQRLHPSLVEASTEACAHCHGTGRVRSVESTALHVLRMAEEEIARSFSPGVTIFVPTAVALFMLNHKRRAIEEMEQRRGVRVYLQADDELTPPEYRLDRIKQLNPGEEVQPRALPSRADHRGRAGRSSARGIRGRGRRGRSARGGGGAARSGARRRASAAAAAGGVAVAGAASSAPTSSPRARAATSSSRRRPRPHRGRSRRRSSHWPTMRKTMARKTRTSPKARRPRAATAKSSAPMASRVAAAAVAAAVGAAGRGARSANSPARRRRARKAGRTSRSGGCRAAVARSRRPARVAGTARAMGAARGAPDRRRQRTVPPRAKGPTASGRRPSRRRAAVSAGPAAATTTARRRPRSPSRSRAKRRARSSRPRHRTCTGRGGTVGRAFVRAGHRSRRRAGRRRGRPTQARLVAPADRVAATPFGRFHNPSRPRGRGYS